MDFKLGRNGQKHAPRHSASGDLVAKRSVAAQALGHIEKPSREHTPGPMGETVLDETLTQPQALQDDSQLLVVQEDAPTADAGGHRLEIKAQTLCEARQIVSCGSISRRAPLGARALANYHEQAVKLQVPENGQGWKSMIGVWGD